MLTDTVNRRVVALGSLSIHNKPINGLFRLLENPALWEAAYAKIYANQGALTPGTDGQTLDGFSKERVAALIARLTNGTFRFTPVRRVFIPKANGKTRPLGLPSGDDKLVQEVVRMLLERIYEPVFRHTSHGFRPQRSCHTAIAQIKDTWIGIRWIVRVDVHSFFDTIDHDILIRLLEKKIDDRRFIGLIRAMLHAGYMENWTFHRTYSGTPQGGICSPILANIYLHELDLFMDDMRTEFNVGTRRKGNPAYRQLSETTNRLRQQWDELKDAGAPPAAFQPVKQRLGQVMAERRQLPSQDLMDSGYKRLRYCRYADDFIIGVIGSKAEAEAIQARVTAFLRERLNLTVADANSSVTHATTGTRFVGFDIGAYSGNRVVKVRRGTRYTSARSMSDRVQAHIPPDVLAQFCTTKKYGNYATVQSHARVDRLEPKRSRDRVDLQRRITGFCQLLCHCPRCETPYEQTSLTVVGKSV